MGSYADAIVASAPVHYWKLNEASGTTAADDVGSLDGTYTDFTSSNYQKPKAVQGEVEVGITLDLASGGAGVSIPTDASLEIQSFTVELWIPDTVFTNALGRNHAWSIDNAATGSSTTRGVQIYRTATDWVAKIYNSAGSSLEATIAAVGGDRVEHHIVAVHDSVADTLTIYQDGVASAPTSTAGFTIAYPTTNARVWIGRQGTGAATITNTGSLESRIAHVAFYNTVMSAATVLEHYTLGASVRDTVEDYEPQTWLNSPSVSTPISASRLGVIESGIRDAFEGRRQEADYVIVSADAPDYMKRGPKAIVCDGTDDQYEITLALTDITQRSSAASNKGALILLSPGDFFLDVNDDFTTSGGVKRCVWDQHASDAIATRVCLMGTGSATTLKLVSGQSPTDNIRIIDIGNNNTYFEMRDLHFYSADSMDDDGERIGLYSDANYHRIFNVRGSGLSGAILRLTASYESLVSGVHIDGGRKGVELDGVYKADIRDVYGEMYGLDSVGVRLIGDCQFNKIVGVNLEGCLKAAVHLDNGPKNNQIEVQAIWGETQGVLFDNATENSLRGRIVENYAAHGLVLQNGSDHNDVDMHVLGNEYHGVLVDASNDNRIRGVVTANGQDNGATPVYDNVHVRSNSNRNDIEVFSRKATGTYSVEARHGVRVNDSDCDDNRVAGDLLDSGAAQAFYDAGTGTVSGSVRTA